jgi:hypothetical protein
MKWQVTLFNRHAQCGFQGQGSTRNQAFLSARRKAGDAFMFEGAQNPATRTQAWNEHYQNAFKRIGGKAVTMADSSDSALTVEIRRTA